MPSDSALGDLAALVAELRAIAEGLRATAARVASRSASGIGGEVSERELARRAKPEIERAERRGIAGTGGLDGRDGRGVTWHRR